MDASDFSLSPELTQALAEGDPRELRALAARRRDQGRPSEAALAEALATLSGGDEAQAVAQLQRGFEESPAWYLGSQLAVLLYEREETAAAIEILAQARTLPGAPTAPLSLDLSLWLLEDDRAAEAEALLAAEEDLLEDPDAIVMRLRALVVLERWDEVRILSETVRAELLETNSAAELHERADTLAAIETARALAAQAADDRPAARLAALEALGWARGDEDALEILRDLGPGPHPAARRFRVHATIEIPLEQDEALEPEVFRTIYEVVAIEVGDLEAACAAVEPEDLSGLVEVGDAEDLGPADGLARGVYSQGDLDPVEVDSEPHAADAGPARGNESSDAQPFRLAAFLKWRSIVQTGGEAKVRIQGGEVMVNGEVDTRRGRRLQAGDRVEVDGEVHIVP